MRIKLHAVLSEISSIFDYLWMKICQDGGTKKKSKLHFVFSECARNRRDAPFYSVEIAEQDVSFGDKTALHI